MRKIIDSHVHLYNVYDSFGKDFCNCLDDMQKQHGVAAFNIASIPTHENYGVDQNILAALYKLHNPKCYAYGGIFYPEAPVTFPLPKGMDSLTQYTELMEMGFDGIKLLELKPAEQKEFQVRTSHSYYDDLFDMCDKNNTPMLMHVADPDTFWDIKRIPQRFIERGWFYGDGTYLSLKEVYSEAYKILEKHPCLDVTFAHFFFYSETPEKLIELFEKYPNVKIDLAPGSEMFASFDQNLEFYKEFFKKYSNRIVFGTDTSLMENTKEDYERYNSISDSVYKFLSTDETITIYGVSSRGICLDDESLDNILYKNFEKSAGKTPKAMNEDKIKKYITKYYDYIKDENLKKWCDKIL